MFPVYIVVKLLRIAQCFLPAVTPQREEVEIEAPGMPASPKMQAIFALGNASGAAQVLPVGSKVSVKLPHDGLGTSPDFLAWVSKFAPFANLRPIAGIGKAQRHRSAVLLETLDKNTAVRSTSVI